MTYPLDRDALKDAAAGVLSLAGADEIEVVASASNSGLSRYANSEIIQNTERSEVRAHVRVAVGARVASASTNQLEPEHLVRAGERARAAASASLPDPEYPGMPDPDDVGHAPSVMSFDEATASATPEERAAAVRSLISVAGTDNAAGIYETGAHAYAVLNSKGIDCFDAYTRCIVQCLADTGEATGWGEASGYAAAQIDVEAIARRARTKADAGRGVHDADPGEYAVVLEEPAAGSLIEYLAYCGFGAKDVIEGESFLTRRAGKKVASGLVTVADDAFHPASAGVGFDLEGSPKRRVAVIDSGIATGPVTDLRTARLLKTDNTGHYSGSAAWGPYASHVVLDGGGASYEELVGGVEDGVLVTRFWYVNVLDRPTVLLTGMTRDGTFRIRGGEVAEPIRNLRFAASVLDALASVEAVGAEVASIAPEWGPYGSTAAPALRLGAFRFSSATTH